MTVRRFDHATQCAGKLRHPSRREARGARRRTPGTPLHIYLCPWCAGYHLGHLDHAAIDRENRFAWHLDNVDRLRVVAELDADLARQYLADLEAELDDEEDLDG